MSWCTGGSDLRRDRLPWRLQRRQERRRPRGVATIGDKLKEFGAGSFSGLLGDFFFLLEELGDFFFLLEELGVCLLGGCEISSGGAELGSEGKRDLVNFKYSFMRGKWVFFQGFYSGFLVLL